MALTAAEVFRDYATDGIPSSGVHEPKKSEIRAWGGNIDLMLNAGGLGTAVWKASRTLLAADLAHSADTIAVVYDDPSSANNGLYVKIGASGSGSWSQITTFLPGYQFVTATDDGNSTANAYTMDTNPRLPFGDGVALVEFVVPATNTNSTVTVSFDGEAPLTIKTASGNAPAIGGLVAGMPVSGVKIGANFFMRSDQASAALVAQAEAAATEAEGYKDQAATYADFARNNWAVIGPFTGTGAEKDYLLSIDPGSENNMFVLAEGVGQMIGAYSLVYAGGLPHIRISLPSDVEFEVRVSNAIPINTPSDGSVGYTKLSSGIIHDAPDKVTPVDADEFSLWDSAATAALKRLSFANLKVALKSYFDTIYNSQPVSEWVAYNPTFTGFGTVSNVKFLSRRVGDSLEVRGTFVCGTSTATEARITLGYNGTNANVTTTDTSKLPGRSTCGTTVLNIATAAVPTALVEPSRGYLLIGMQSSSTNGYQPANGNSIASSGTAISINANVPISGW